MNPGHGENQVRTGDAQNAATVRRILESTIAAVTSGFVLWWLTGSAPKPTSSSQPITATSPAAQSQATPSLEKPDDKLALSIDTAGSGAAPGLAPKTPAARPAQGIGPFSGTPGPANPMPSLGPPAQPYAIPVGSILFFEDFSHYRDGDVTDWGPETAVGTAPDRHKWLVPRTDGLHPVGRNIRLPNEFYLECRYFAGMSDVTRGVFGWWKEPIVSKVTFKTEQGAKYTIEWVIGCGNDALRLNALGSSSLYTKKYFHTIKLPGGESNEIGLAQPTGTLRINRDNGSIQVLLDGQLAASGIINMPGQLVGFEFSAVIAKNGTLSFTDFKIGR